MIDVLNKTRKKTPAFPWEKIKNEILGKKYQLSLVLTDNRLIKKINKEYRKKDKIASTLSFPLNEKEGEIFINNTNKKPEEIIFLFIHSLLHLKGLKHGDEMEKQEKKYLNKFKKHGA
jgi:probable rRNA maturation factor